MMALVLGAFVWAALSCFGITAGQVAPSNVDCSNVAAGTRMWGCKAYHECREDGSSAYVECAWGMVYNEISRKCEHAGSVDTPCGRSYRRECRDYGPPFGKIAVKDYVNPQNGLPCQYFFTCANGHFYGTQKCEGYQVFNEVLQYCVKPDAAPSSCNPFGPRVANVREVRRHWWKSETAGAKSMERLKQPWWKAKKTNGESLKKSLLQQKHWLTRTAAARKSKSSFPRFEKMSAKGNNDHQRLSPKQRKGVSNVRQEVKLKEKIVRQRNKEAFPRRRNKNKGKRPTNQPQRTSSYKRHSERPSKPVTEPTNTTKSPQNSTKATNTITATVNTKTTPEDDTTTANTSSQKLTSTTSQNIKESKKSEHPWNSKERQSSRSIVPQTRPSSDS